MSSDVDTAEARARAELLYKLAYNYDERAHLMEKLGDLATARDERAKAHATALEYAALIQSGVRVVG